MSASTTPSAPTTSKLRTFLPILEWLPNYDRAWLRGDILAAITVWALLVPEAMAYAGIAGMPPEAGLYAARWPCWAMRSSERLANST
ncbi:MAG: SulP family inorganic anion transporter [Caldilineaceae bacterium]|nr:SulP family inorganic anion transporter [Caldilineaceae bacterium]